MPQKSKEKGFTPKNIGILVLVLGAIGVGTYFVGNYLGLWSITQVPPSQEGFSIHVVDGMLGKTLPNDEFSYVLYGSNDLADWLEFDELDSDDSLSHITTGDFEEDYTYFVIAYTGLVEHDDTIYGEAHDIGTRAYYARWVVLDTTGPNVLIAYQTPSDSDFLLVNSETFQNIAYTDIPDQQNFTVIAAINQSQINDAKWVAGPNYSNEEDDYLILKFTFNVTIALTDVSMSGASKYRISDTVIGFKFTELSGIASVFHLEWGEDAPDCVINDYKLYFGQTLLASH